MSLSWHRDGAELHLCRVWVQLHLHPPACPPAPPRACFSRASASLALHGEQAPAMPPSPKPPGAALARGRDPAGPVGCGLGRRLGPAAAVRGIRTPRSVIPTRPGNLREDPQRLRPRLGSGSGLRSALVAPGAAVCAACRGRAIPPLLQSHSAAPASPAHRGNPWGQGRSGIGDQGVSGCQWGALEPDWGMLAKLCAGFVLSRALWDPTNQSNTRVRSRKSCLGTLLLQGIGVPSIPQQPKDIPE